MVRIEFEANVDAIELFKIVFTILRSNSFFSKFDYGVASLTFCDIFSALLLQVGFFETRNKLC